MLPRNGSVMLIALIMTKAMLLINDLIFCDDNIGQDSFICERFDVSLR